MAYFVKTPWWLKKFYSNYVWDIPGISNEVYLTFDDGPHPECTAFILDQLKRVEAKATFFCIGKNVVEFPDLYERILLEGHSVGNHTQNHPNGWKTDDKTYLEDVAKAAKYIDSKLFRPPYGRITKFQASQIPTAMHRKDARIIMWDVLSGDFDPEASPQKCLERVTLKTRPGSIIVFHDSEKVYKKILEILPKTLDFLTEKGFRLAKIPGD